MYIISFPESGGTWLSLMTAWMIGADFDVYELRYKRTRPAWAFLDELKPHDNLVRITYQSVLGKVYKTHVLPSKLKDKSTRHPAVYLYRNPMDLLYNWWLKHKKKHPALYGKMSLADFAAWKGPEWAAHVTAWHGHARLQDMICVEDVVSDTQDEMMVLAETLSEAGTSDSKEVWIPTEQADEAVLKFRNALTKPSVGRGIEAFRKNSKALNVLCKHCWKTMELLGYSETATA